MLRNGLCKMYTMCEVVSVLGRVTAKARVQQCSVLSPLLFIIMLIKDLVS